ncbi:MAG TPA: hypothetical protein VGN64_09220 [Dyadobacter sp.]|jgi:hypothetical protein|nr:hypothetical protein [Dyadobacter sp.]
MKTLNNLIRLISITILMTWTVQSGNCKSVTSDTIPNSRAFSFDILPEINRDLKLCDLVKKDNVLLSGKVILLGSNVLYERSEKIAAQKQVKKERRKRKWSHIGRTVLEVVVIVTIVTLKARG